MSSLSIFSSYRISCSRLYVPNHEQEKKKGGARGVMVIVLGNGHDDTSSNPEWDWLHFTLH